MMFSKLPPDSGNWYYLNSKWIEIVDDSFFLNETFQVKKNGSYNITVDGFPRQGNRYVRRKILFSLPSAAMPYPLIHKQAVMEKAIQEKHYVFSTFRDPIDSISSYISEFIKTERPHRILNPLSKKIYTKKDYLFIEKCFLFYIRMTDFIANNINDIFVVPFDSIKNDINNNLSLKIASVIGDLNYLDPSTFEPHSSADLFMKEYLMSKKFYDISARAYQSYDKVLSLKDTHFNKFI